MILTPFLPLVLQALAVLSPAALPHPHHPKAIQMGGAAGKISVSYFTVPYNAEHLKALEPGFEWHLGFALLTTEVPLQIGDVAVPAGEYKLQSRRGKDQGQWDLVLKNRELAMAEMRVSFARNDDQKVKARARAEEVKDRLAKTGDDRVYLLTTSTFEAEDDEHLTMTVIHHGFVTVQRMSEEPAGGVEFDLRISHGDLHREVKVMETYAGAAKASAEKDKD